MTMMVRDEADIVGAMVQHHLDQGIDLFLVTDNGSVDGTTEILEEFARQGVIELRHDPRHLKQQHEVVTAMSREAARRGARWVLNADADEFWLAQNGELTIREALERIDPAIGAFIVPVTDMTGPPAASGTGLQRLVYQDRRPDELMRRLGIHAHATPDVAFVASEDVVVAQGNHFVSVESHGEPAPGAGLEVLHFPWRSWAQFSRKVENAGRAYEASPHLKPSANHHGMRDYRRLQDGFLFGAYVCRHPSPEELAEGLANGWFVEDRRIADAIPSPQPDEPLDDEHAAAERALMQRIAPLEQRLQDLEARERKSADDLDYRLRHVAELDEIIAGLRDEVGALQSDNLGLRQKADELDGLRGRRWFRVLERVAHRLGARRR
ncbi:glycosyltransferase family 2 protein [Microbacterium sp. zg.Y625]|uniref:glycosyltransferase family 2 protein n=1 Tax=Microbacterium jiangjiandongii TaxID=3049071 RepID=UPI00214CFE2F|nr:MULTISPECIES: glycosyltransferase family 2 protein [unclassified Microbacterium]MCR2793740.1 glycosyltransferase family 2 protein [Microbacterium sp. zg.Y625]MCR2815656.1 glycosyltransferase family 2 protein [Microbacterium sp. zg.Y843]WIM26085.1 glycosyltransferase family 2 protein [Microbacterium sp. zg-Y625]